MYNASEIQGTHKGQNTENLHLVIDFCKHLLGVQRTTCSSAVFTGLGRCPLSIYRMYNDIEYWKYFSDSDNCKIVDSY